MSVVEFSNEATVAVLAETFTESLSDLEDRTRQIAVLKRLHELLDSPAPQHYIYETVEGCEELQIVRAGSDQRIFCRLVLGIPEGNKQYNVLFVFYVDPHRYRPDRLAPLDAAARRRLDEIANLDGIDDVEAYLETMNAFTAEQIQQRIERLEG